MIFQKLFYKKLKKLSSLWVVRGIISQKQADDINSLYSNEKKFNLKLSVIVIGLAVFLISIGLMLFYAANWKEMSPFAKITQVFILVAGLYSIAFYMLAVKNMNILVGRAFLVLAMVSFGVGISLIAQIYHISAHPTNGVFVWALGTLLVSWITGEKWGLFLSALLFFIWNVWEYSVFNNPNYFYIIFFLLIGYFFYKELSKVGIVITLFVCLIWFYQVNIYWIDISVVSNKEIPVIAFVLSHTVIGALLIAISRLVESN